MLNTLIDTLLDTVLDTLKAVPLLFLVYLILEYLDLKRSKKSINYNKLNKFGPIIASALGLFPQCGFSAAAAELYNKNILKGGTLIAIFIATSDEALPVMFSNIGSVKYILPMLLCKFVFGIIFGFILNYTIFAKQKINVSSTEKLEFNASSCEVEGHHSAHHQNTEDNKSNNNNKNNNNSNNNNSNNEKAKNADNIKNINSADNTGRTKNTNTPKNHHSAGNVFLHALYHTVKISFFILITMLLINVLVDFLGKDFLSDILLKNSIFSPIIAAAIGLIPGCSTSVLITMALIKGNITFSAAIAGLSAGAGFGYVMLFKGNKKNAVKIILLTFAVSSVSGIILNLLGF